MRQLISEAQVYRPRVKELGPYIRITDRATPWLQYLARTFEPEFKKALGSLGYHLRQEMKDAMMQGGPPGRRWPKRSQVTTHRTLDQHLERSDWRTPARLRSSINHYANTYGRLVHAVGYKRDKERLRVTVGFLSKAAARRAYHLQHGFTTRVTPKMRRLFYAAGLRPPKGDVRTPGRDLVMPVVESFNIDRFITRKIWEYLRKADGYAQAA